MSIGERLKDERERLAFNQADFAAIGKASKRSQIEWEKGTAYPNAKYLAAIAAAGADVQYILTGRRAGAYTQAQTQPAEIMEDGADPLARRKRQVHQIVDQLDEAGLEAVQDELEKIERIKSLEREVAELKRQASGGVE
jgi:transcriptional regulator with XRE-family HTH domain